MHPNSTPSSHTSSTPKPRSQAPPSLSHHKGDTSRQYLSNTSSKTAKSSKSTVKSSIGDLLAYQSIDEEIFCKKSAASRISTSKVWTLDKIPVLDIKSDFMRTENSSQSDDRVSVGQKVSSCGIVSKYSSCEDVEASRGDGDGGFIGMDSELGDKIFDSLKGSIGQIYCSGDRSISDGSKGVLDSSVGLGKVGIGRLEKSRIREGGSEKFNSEYGISLMDQKICAKTRSYNSQGKVESESDSVVLCEKSEILTLAAQSEILSFYGKNSTFAGSKSGVLTESPSSQALARKNESQFAGTNEFSKSVSSTNLKNSDDGQLVLPNSRLESSSTQGIDLHSRASLSKSEMYYPENSLD
jgi:hypothetical protein